jgi:gas vesicle protein
MKFLLGLVTGIFAGLMFAPSSGSETRRRISESANELVESGRDKARQVSETAQHKVRQASNMASDKVQQATDYAKQKTNDIGRAAENAGDAINEKIQRRTA